ncbi:MAG TPA: hypothetical protein VN962_16545 [Polyangia bacterium]|nr:hypothetical protein [Polyangia bacterium]
MLRRRALSTALVCLAALAARPARADDILVSLDYQADTALSGCPGPDEFRAHILRQLGRDPFVQPAPHRLVVRIAPKGIRLEGRVEWRDAQDQWEGERTFSARNESCEQMVRAMALATAIQIQLLALASPPGNPTPPTVDALPPEPPNQPPTPVVTVRPRESRIAIEAGLMVVQDLGGAPALLAPRIAVSLGRPSALALRLAASGFGPTREVTAPEGAAQLDRVLVTLQVVHFFRVGRRLQPFAAVGAGLQAIHVHGISVNAALGSPRDGRGFSGLAMAGGGVAIALTTGLFVVVEGEATLYRPDVNVQVGADLSAARFEGEGFFAHAGILARF